MLRSLILAPLLLLAQPAFAVPGGQASIQILDGLPGSGEVLSDQVLYDPNSTGSQSVSYNGPWANSPGIDGLGGTIAGNADLLAEILGDTLRAKADLTHNDQTMSGRRLGVARAVAAATYREPYLVSGPAGASGLVDVRLAATLSGTFDIEPAVQSGAFVFAAVTAEPIQVGGDGTDVRCDISTFPVILGSCDNPSVSLTQNGNLWDVTGTFSGIVQVPVNQISDFGSTLQVHVDVGGGSLARRSAGLFDNSLTFSVASADPDVTLIFVPEACTDDPSDFDCDSIANALDLCPYYAELEPGADANSDGRGDACECGDQNEDGLINIGDILAINAAIFGQEPAGPLCDANDDGLCNIGDILAVNAKVFGAETFCARYPAPVP